MGHLQTLLPVLTGVRPSGGGERLPGGTDVERHLEGGPERTDTSRETPGPGTAVGGVRGGGGADGRGERGLPLGRRTEPASPSGRREQCEAPAGSRGGVGGRRGSRRPSAPAVRAARPPPPPPPARWPQVEERPLSRRRCPVLHPQDPEFQKHAAQILRDMLRQEERELQVRSPPRTGRRPGGAVPAQRRLPVCMPGLAGRVLPTQNLTEESPGPLRNCRRPAGAGGAEQAVGA